MMKGLNTTDTTYKSLVIIVVYNVENYCYIPSCDSVAHVFLSGLVGRVQDW